MSPLLMGDELNPAGHCSRCASRTGVCAAPWLLAVLLLLFGLPPSAQAALRVAADLPAAGVKAGDRVIALRGQDGEGKWQEFQASDPLTFQWDWLRCSALRSCKVRIKRAGQSLDLPLWIDEVELEPELQPDDAALLGLDDDDPERDASLIKLTERWQQGGRNQLAAWLTYQRSLHALYRGDMELAQQLERAALALLTDSGQIALQLELDFSVALMTQVKPEQAVPRLERLLQRELPPAMRIRASRILAAIDFSQSRLAEAEARLRTVETLARKQAPASHLLASTLNSLAVVIRPQGRLQEARRLFGEAMAAARDFEPESVLQAMIGANIGLLERAAGDLSAAELALRHAVELLHRLPHREALLFDNQSNLALVLLDRGRTREAAALWNGQLPSDDDAHHQERAGRVQHNLALVYAQQGNIGEAIRRLQQAIVHWKRASPGGMEEANAQLDLGLYAALAEDFETARTALEQALRLHRRIAPAGTGVVGAHDALATVALQQGKLDHALDWQRKALVLRDAGEQPNWRRDFALTQLARIELQLDRPTAALQTLDEAERIARGAGREGMLAAALALRGDSLLRLARTQEARRAACAGVAQIELLRGTSPSGAEYRSSFVHSAAPIYRSCMDALLADGDQRAALELYQSERRLTLNALIADRDLRFADLPAELLTERRSALVDLQQVAVELENGADTTLLAELKQRRNDVRQRLRRIDERIHTALPQLANWQTTGSAVPEHAGAGQQVVAFAVRPEDTLRIVLQEDAPPRIDRLPVGQQELSAAVVEWRKALLGRTVAPEREQARLLYRWLLADLEFDEEVELLIVPDGPLHALPFAALLDAQGRRLIERQLVLLSALLPDSQRVIATDRKPPIDLLALTDSRASGTRAALPGAAQELALLKQLPWSRIKLLSDAQSSSSALRHWAPQARLMHFAVHGINDPQSPMDSTLLLHDAAGQADPLAVWDIFESLRLQAELVVLAACDTAPGASVLDDGWLGLTRAFHFAGAEQVVSALWSVDDDSTAKLMGELHRQLADGKSAKLALATAQRRLLRGELVGAPANSSVKGGTVQASGSRGVGGLSGKGAARSPDTGSPYYWAGFHLYLAPR